MQDLQKPILSENNRQEGLRFNQGKPRYDLLEPFAISELVKIFTKGAEKYAERNWEKGMSWSKVLASLKRHIAAFEQGEDFDPELGTYHMANAAWNALALVSYYKLAPHYDDRNHKYLNEKRYALDIDDVLADFTGYWAQTHGMPRPTSWQFDRLMIDKFDKMKYDGSLDQFYLNIPVLTTPEDIPFEPVCYITSRPVNSSISEEWLDRNGFPSAPVITVGIEKSKVDALRENQIDIMVDDKWGNFVEINKSGIFCYLFDRLHNKRYDAGYKRIFSLKDLK